MSGIGGLLSLRGHRSCIRIFLGANQPDRPAHIRVGGEPCELTGESPEIDAVLTGKGIDPEAMLLDVTMAAEADAEDVMGLLVDRTFGPTQKCSKIPLDC
jgi:hypothetical protein